MRSIIFMFFLLTVWYRFVRGFAICHEDFTLKPPDGVLKRNSFNWLGFVRYIHVTTNLPHPGKAPRVVLIHIQFVLGTATDMLELPQHYKLGNIVFGEYERDEIECGLKRHQIKLGEKCAPMHIEVPHTDITPHPEYSRFGVENSLALIKLLTPMKSLYMIPVCMPTLKERYRKIKNKHVLMIDYLSVVPLESDEEKMGKKTLKLYTHKECWRHRKKAELSMVRDLGSEGVTHMLCTSGCAIRPGVPIISHNAKGGFELIGIAAGSAPCFRNSMRNSLIQEPPLYIDVYPYVTWMVSVITAYELPSAFPQNYRLTGEVSKLALRSRSKIYRDLNGEKYGWNGRLFMSGTNCFERPPSIEINFFYIETFAVYALPAARVRVHMKISGGKDCIIQCARLRLPSRLVQPTITGVGGWNISIYFETVWAPLSFEYTLSLSGTNATEEQP